MCEFCISHGEGKKWYEVMSNYSRELLARDNRKEFIKNLFPRLRCTSVYLNKLESARKNMPIAYRFIRRMATRRMKRDHFGQVVPLEDAEMIIDMVHSVTRLPCVCREATEGVSDARYCLALGIDPMDISGEHPDLKKSLEAISPEEAKRLLRKFDEEGLVHSIWTFKTPFIGGLCNCDRDCLAYRFQVSADLLQVMFRAEYVAGIEPLLCRGCRNCQKVCQFGALEYSSLNRKSMVNARLCYGCGVCRSACEQGAISLRDRKGAPESAQMW